MIKAESQHIGNNFKLGEGSTILCAELIIGNDVIIDKNTTIYCPNGKVVLGDQSYIGSDTVIRLANFSMGEYVKLHNHGLLNGIGNVQIGHNCWIGQNCVLNGEANLIVGNNVGIGTYSSVWTHGYFGQLVDGCMINSTKDTIIEDDAWLIGSYNTIFPGVTIGKQAVLMGTSVVTKSLERNKIYSGNPARDITDKIGEPYKPLSWNDKKDVLRKALLHYFTKYHIAHEIGESSIKMNELGEIVFDGPPSKENQVAFVEDISAFQLDFQGSIFCLKSKTYTKKYSAIEILVKKILNPTVARFIPISA
jgi:acetyltransferase-like isoleucine patch superfamily enzyme